MPVMELKEQYRIFLIVGPNEIHLDISIEIVKLYIP